MTEQARWEDWQIASTLQQGDRDWAEVWADITTGKWLWNSDELQVIVSKEHYETRDEAKRAVRMAFLKEYESLTRLIQSTEW